MGAGIGLLHGEVGAEKVRGKTKVEAGKNWKLGTVGGISARTGFGNESCHGDGNIKIMVGREKVSIFLTVV